MLVRNQSVYLPYDPTRPSLKLLLSLPTDPQHRTPLSHLLDLTHMRMSIDHLNLIPLVEEVYRLLSSNLELSDLVPVIEVNLNPVRVDQLHISIYEVKH